MKTPVVIATVLTLAITGTAPSLASAAGPGDPAKIGGTCPEWMCGGNHNEVLASSQER